MQPARQAWIVEAWVPAEARRGDAVGDRLVSVFVGGRALCGGFSERSIGIGHARLLVGVDHEDVGLRASLHVNPGRRDEGEIAKCAKRRGPRLQARSSRPANGRRHAPSQASASRAHRGRNRKGRKCRPSSPGRACRRNRDVPAQSPRGAAPARRGKARNLPARPDRAGRAAADRSRTGAGAAGFHLSRWFVCSRPFLKSVPCASVSL
jgi:hypothetical protein